MTALRWGILATGGIAHSFTSDLVDNGFTVQAVGSRSQESADAFAAEFGIPTAHPSYEELAADPDVDIIYISTPHPFHAANAALALDAGKHVLIEKPIALNARETREIVELAAEKGLLVLEAMWTRFLPHMVRIREILAAGTLGEVQSLVADHTQKLSDDPAHRINSLELGGGALLDLGIYPVSFAHAVFGAPESIVSSATFKDTGADAQLAVAFTYAGGQVASTFTSSVAKGPNTASLLGSAARIDIDGVWYTGTSFRVVATDGEILESFSSDFVGRGMHFQAAEAQQLVSEGKTASEILSPAESVAIMETLDEIRAQIGLVYPGE
ncbi:Gfo/Idh/MocA family protein [Leifsonia sp. A12D58]|uniref:Gfo/Idh/MocA family protein n=1 Tax=Leifsonia sp. A12D58 TaxID=3397674 RepID=UPI0039E18DA0